ncbi:hypothetical protein VPNG_07040 [Cytospora leucostoma]|uniref:Cytochrome P450 n=1 Tax=Cytospora leucostoma TaxID=1230097 RepID=A0A423WNW3_9PEZI|nr:hypothetical protein VPNG_07040 [Cytospora leucostoma]
MASKGEDWKALRKRFNPGFAPQHLMTLLPSIIDKVSLFVTHLDGFARTGEEFSLQSLATNLTFDVIGRLALDIDLGAQTSSPGEFMRVFHSLIETYTGEQIDLPRWCTPRLEWKRKRLAEQVRTLLSAIVRDAYAERNERTKPRSILSMSLQDVGTLTPEVINVTCDQLSSFLFAGHDTTSSTISWMLYELSRTPHALRAVRAELDDLLGPDTSPAAVTARLLAPGGEEIVHRMSYTSAVIKETLRLWPPGATARMTKPGDGLGIVLPIASNSLGSEPSGVNVDTMMLYHVISIIQRDPTVFGETANAFVPERWLDKSNADKIPAGAWRAFERGPRNCIGQELATIEMRIVIALVARRYDFSKVGIGAPTLDSITGEPEIDKAGDC